MNRRIIALVVPLSLLLCGVVTAAAQQPDSVPRQPSVELPAELDRVLRDYERAWAGGDAAALARLFTEDGFVPSGAGWRRGRSRIEAQYSGASGDLRLRAHDYAQSGDVAFIIGAFGYGEGAARRDSGKFILALRRGPEGRWLIAADLDNANRPPPGT